jgi:hypothetical protein
MTDGEQKDRAEHAAALQRFGGVMPEVSTPLRDRRDEKARAREKMVRTDPYRRVSRFNPWCYWMQFYQPHRRQNRDKARDDV